MLPNAEANTETGTHSREMICEFDQYATTTTTNDGGDGDYDGIGTRHIQSHSFDAYVGRECAVNE